MSNTAQSQPESLPLDPYTREQKDAQWFKWVEQVQRAEHVRRDRLESCTQQDQDTFGINTKHSIKGVPMTITMTDLASLTSRS